jgi:periplasmic divalent cation tolerance protein
MKTAGNYVIVLVTAPDLKTARSLARVALEARLVACANLVPRLESHYWWQGKLESGREILILFKTTRSKLAALEKAMLKKHPYDTPEIIAVPLQSGTAGYLQWIAACVKPGEAPRSKVKAQEKPQE